MGFEMILPTRPTKEVKNLLGVFTFRHSASWFADAGGSASSGVSAFCYRGPEDVGVRAVVVPIRKLVKVQGQVFPANMMKRSNNTSFEKTPKAIYIASVSVSAHVFMSAVIHRIVLVTFSSQFSIAIEIIGCNKVNLFADSLLNESIQRLRVGPLNQLANHVSLTSDCADHCVLPSPTLPS
jgi:hypothetical protein